MVFKFLFYVFNSGRLQSMNLSYCAACFIGSSRPVLQLQWTECLRFPKSHMLRPNSPCDGIWSGGHLGGDEATWKTHERIRAFCKKRRRHRISVFVLHHLRRIHLPARKMATESACPLILDFTASGIVEMSMLRFRLPSLWELLL